MKELVKEMYFEEDMAPMGKLFKLQDQQMRTDVYVMVTDFGMIVNYIQETVHPDLPKQILHKAVEEINAEAVRKLFGAQNYSEMLERIKERFHEETAYDDLLNYLRENKIV